MPYSLFICLPSAKFFSVSVVFHSHSCWFYQVYCGRKPKAQVLKPLVSRWSVWANRSLSSKSISLGWALLSVGIFDVPDPLRNIEPVNQTHKLRLVTKSFPSVNVREWRDFSRSPGIDPRPNLELHRTKVDLVLLRVNPRFSFIIPELIPHKTLMFEN